MDRARLPGGADVGGELTLAWRLRVGSGGVDLVVGLSSSSSLMDSTRSREGRRPVARGGTEDSDSDLNDIGTGRLFPRWSFSCLCTFFG